MAPQNIAARRGFPLYTGILTITRSVTMESRAVDAGCETRKNAENIFDHNDQKQRNIKYKDKQTDRTSCQIIDQDRNAACPSGCNLVRRRKAVDSNRINKKRLPDLTAHNDDGLFFCLPVFCFHLEPPVEKGCLKTCIPIQISRTSPSFNIEYKSSDVRLLFLPKI